MSKRVKWQVWSLAPNGAGWIVVDEGTEKEAKDGAARRTANSARLGVRGKYVALPDGETPAMTLDEAEAFLKAPWEEDKS